MTSLGSKDLARAARLLLVSNLREGHDPHFGTRYRYVCPSLQKYRWQWYWDSCFHSIALAHLEPELAVGELDSLLAAQEPDGFMGHVTYWSGADRTPFITRLESRLTLRPHHSALIQPPLIAQAAERVSEITGDPEFLVRAYPKLAAHYRWLSENRCPDGDGLIVLISPFESGMDNTPAYDRPLGIGAARPGWWPIRLRVAGLHVSHLLRGRNYRLDLVYRLCRFNVKDVAVNCIYAEALRAMYRIASGLNRADDAGMWAAEAERVERAIVNVLYDEDAQSFFPTYGPDRRFSRVLTASCLLPLLLESLPEEIATALVEQHLVQTDKFWTEYPVPTVATSEPTFLADPGARRHPLIWRGSSWINTNWFVARGLRRHGYQELASTIEEKSASLVERSGFREFFNPHTGEGQGAANFAWSTLIVDMI